MSDAKFWLKHGSDFPYDAGDSFWIEGNPPPPPVDSAHAAARGILANMCDRRGIKRGFEDIDLDVRVEIAETIAAIIRESAGSGAP